MIVYDCLVISVVIEEALSGGTVLVLAGYSCRCVVSHHSAKVCGCV